MPDNPDATVAAHGTVCLLTPLSDAAKVWAFNHLDETPRYAGALVIEPRYLGAIFDAMTAAGLRVQPSP